MINEEIDVKKHFNRDLNYIKNDIITKELIKNPTKEIDEKNRYIKFSVMLNAVTTITLTKGQYKKYWISQYRDYPKELKILLEAIEEKFKNGLTSREEMIKLIVHSNDFDSEKQAALRTIIPKKEQKTNNVGKNEEEEINVGK